MTELEQILMTSLKRLMGESETREKQLLQQLATLSEQVKSLSARVDKLTVELQR